MAEEGTEPSLPVKARDPALKRCSDEELVLPELSPAFPVKLSVQLFQRSEAEAGGSHAGYWPEQVHCRSKDLMLVRNVLTMNLADLPVLRLFSTFPEKSSLDSGEELGWGPAVLTESPHSVPCPPQLLLVALQSPRQEVQNLLLTLHHAALELETGLSAPFSLMFPGMEPGSLKGGH